MSFRLCEMLCVEMRASGCAKSSCASGSWIFTITLFTNMCKRTHMAQPQLGQLTALTGSRLFIQSDLHCLNSLSTTLCAHSSMDHTQWHHLSCYSSSVGLVSSFAEAFATVILQLHFAMLLLSCCISIIFDNGGKRVTGWYMGLDHLVVSRLGTRQICEFRFIWLWKTLLVPL